MQDKDPGAAWEGGALYSQRFGDVYSSRAGALAQSRMVFLAGCGLPGRWAGRTRFTVAELGFGTGLNILALLDLWSKHRPANATLHIMSVEGFLLTKAEVERSLAAFPELEALAQQLLAQWPQQENGWVRFDFPQLGATLDLALMDVREALAGWYGQADSWFLDGFAPAKNPDMWGEDVLAMVGAKTAPGGRASTWSAAGFVRRGLAAAKFHVERLPGFSGKRERIEAVMAGDAHDRPIPKVAVVGAGISGASVVRALSALGGQPTVFANGPMASGNPAALVTPRLAAGSSVAAQLHAQAFGRSIDLINRSVPDAILAQSVLRVLKPSEVERADATIASGLFKSSSLVRQGDDLLFADALVVEPALVRQQWGGEPFESAIDERIETIAQKADGWWLNEHGPFEAVVVAAGFETARLVDLPLRPVRGQVTTAPVVYDGVPTSWGGYVVPTRDGFLFGATHGRGEADSTVRAEDRQTNLDMLSKRMPDLAATLSGCELTDVAGVRAAAGDHQPVAGELADGLFVLGGMGGRGFALAPLLGEHVAALVVGVSSPLSVEAAQLLDPKRLRPR